ncbi:DUF4872 domain-containing protein [Modestobacter muralis]|uniref:DUF4872 domain-containing protein n=1 Tax=Modestobacter muralis TaxID=1608614 RepID=UPI0023EC64CE|nr:DUF4872 domain-containing protein [Modestobacter muralis]
MPTRSPPRRPGSATAVRESWTPPACRRARSARRARRDPGVRRGPGSWPQVLDTVTLEAAVAALPVFIEKAGTGGGLFRRLQAACCHDVAGRQGSSGSALAGLAYDRCAEAWSRLGRAATTDVPLLDRVATAAEAASRLPALDDEAADLLAAAAEELRASA